jgi:hypothetical protein
MDTNSYIAREKTSLLLTLEKVTSTSLKWLSKSKIDKNYATWSTDQLSYVAGRIEHSLIIGENWLNDINKISQFIAETNSENSKAEFLNELGITGSGGKRFNTMALQLLSILTLHLTSKGNISLKYGHKIHLPQRPEQFVNYYKRGLVPEIISHLYAVSTPPRFEICKEYIPQCLKDVIEELGNNTRSSRQRSIMNCMELVTYLNIETLSSITIEDLKHYFIVNKKENGNPLMYSTFNQMLDKAFKLDLAQQWENLKGFDIVDMTAKNEFHSFSSLKTFTSKKQLTDMTCDSIDYKNIVIETIINELTILKIGDHHLSVKSSLTEYHPENLTEDKYWKRTQLDFLRQATEKGTKKSKRGRLAFLNSYLFDYLPVFFRNNPKTKFKYPETPSEFLSFIFVCKSDTIMLSKMGNLTGEIFPVTLLDYVYSITNEKAVARGNTKTNAGRDTIAEIQRYFSFMMEKFPSVPECSFKTNPISDFDKNQRAGYKYNQTNKKKIVLDYWILFRMFLKQLSYALVENAEHVVFKDKLNKKTLKINKTIEWLDTKIKINEVDLSFLGEFAFQDWKAPSYVTNYQTITSLYTLAWSGLRAANVNWLDIRSFKWECPDSYSENSFVDLFVNTDKALEEPFTSSVSGHVMQLLERVARLRLKVDRNGFNKPIHYQGEEGSKWGEIKPLLQATKKNGIAIAKTNLLVGIVDAFEKCLMEHNKKAAKEEKFEFKTEIYYLPKKANPLNFSKIPNYVHADTDYTATIKYIEDGYSSLFTPLKRMVKFTPHSLRVTFDSVCSVLADPESVGKICTGQGEETVGYYTVNTSKDIAEIKSIQHKKGFINQFPEQIENSPLSIASAKNQVIDEADYLRKHALGTATDSFNCISLSSIEVKGGVSPIEALIKASANQIAFNRTHICPFNNNCPKEVISALSGEKNCSICPYAIFCNKNAVGISAELKRLGDIACDLTYKMKSDNLLSKEIEQLQDDRDRVIKSISGWYPRHMFISEKINSNEYVTGKIHKNQLRHITGSIAGKNLINRLKEVDGVSTLESPKLERESRKLTRKIKSLLNVSPESFSIDEDNISDVSVALEMIKTICNLNDISESELSSKLNTSANTQIEWLNQI